MNSRMWLALIAVYIAWGSTYLAMRFAVETIPPFLMAGTRFLIAGMVVYLWRCFAGDPMPTRSQWRSSSIIGAFLLVGGIGGVAWAEQHVDSGFAALLVAAIPLWIVLVDAVRPGGKRPTRQTMAGVLVGIAGIAILVGPSQNTGGPEGLNPLGVIAIMLSSLSWSIGSIYSRGADLPGSALLGTGMEMLAGSAGLFLLGTLTGEWGRLELAAVSLRSLGGLVYLILVGSLVGFTAYTWLLRVAPMPIVVTYAYVNPLIAVILGSILAQEELTPRVLLAIPIILASVFLTNRVRTKTSEPEPRQLAVPVPAGED